MSNIRSQRKTDATTSSQAMSKKTKKTTQSESSSDSPREHIQSLIKWMSQGVYEKEQIIAMALLCAVAGENIFLLGPPGTAKSMVSSRLKKVFKDGQTFDYLMSRFSTPDEIFGPVSISKLKSEDRYERLTSGYLPEADIVFLDEIWKAGPSIQNTLLSVINEHLFYNGGKPVQVPMKVLIAASNELPAKNEGLEALWDRFLIRMVSNCIEGESSFFKMLEGKRTELMPLSEQLYITSDLLELWKQGAAETILSNSVRSAIKYVRKRFASKEKEDEHQLRYYISDRRWVRAYNLMQTSAYLNGRNEIELSDYLLLIHSFWSDVETIPAVIDIFNNSMTAHIKNQLEKIDKGIRQLVMPRQQADILVKKMSVQYDEEQFKEYEYFFYLIENYPEGETYFSKWGYKSLTSELCDGISFFDTKRQKYVIHTLIPGSPFETKNPNEINLKKVKLQKCTNGLIIDGIPYLFKRKSSAKQTLTSNNPIVQQLHAFQDVFRQCAESWGKDLAQLQNAKSNLFLSPADLSLVSKLIKEVQEQMNTIEVKINNLLMLV